MSTAKNEPVTASVKSCARGGTSGLAAGLVPWSAQRVGATIETEQETNQQRCGMNHIKPHSGGRRSRTHRCPPRPAESRGRSCCRTRAAAGPRCDAVCPDGTTLPLSARLRVPAGKAQSQHGSAVSTQPEYGPHQWGKSPIQCCRGRSAVSRAENQKRKQGWHNGFAA